MTDTRLLVQEHVLQHEYDSVKAHAYYMANRKLKGRKKASAEKPKKRIYEDELPETSPSGAKLVDFDKSGRATYADGSTYDSNGWNKTGHDRNTRVNAAQQKLMKLKNEAKKISDPARKKQRLEHLLRLQRALDLEKRKGGNKSVENA